MKNRQIVFGLVGIAIGFVLGFFTSDLIKKEPAPVGASPAVTQDAGQLPENHPSMEDMQRLQDLQQRAEANPNDKEARVALANSYYDMQRFDAAIKWYEEAVRLDPNNPNVNTDLGTSYLYTNNPQKAIELYQKSLAADPKHPQTLQNLGFAYFSLTKFQDAIAVWEKLLTLHPEYQHKAEIEKQITAAKAHLSAGATKPAEKPAMGAKP
ncbi:MAG: tetratricopeptide repeat protein [Acidobacteria bacterium]|nr:MAG: tetratricopeptide repeat protein [Acidobacteriota bacterium]